MEAGDSGFCIARLGDKIVETEVPNLLLAPLAPVLKRPAACKRPAAAMAADKAEVDDNNLDEDDGDDKSDPSEEMQEEPPSHDMEEEPFCEYIEYVDAVEEQVEGRWKRRLRRASLQMSLLSPLFASMGRCIIKMGMLMESGASFWATIRLSKLVARPASSLRLS